MMNNACARSVALALSAAVGCLASATAESVSRYNVVWETPSADHTGQMPLGNGDIAAGVYAIEDDNLYLLLSKNDAYTYNGDLFKTGRVRISLSPNPFAAGKPFRQTLDLDRGSIVIEADGVKIRVWADANHPVYHVQIDSPRRVRVSATPEFWERMDGCQWNKTAEPIDPPTQDVRVERNGRILWYYAVGDRSVFPAEMEFYDVPEMVEKFPDPFRFNTFGNLLESRDLELHDGELRGIGKAFHIRIHALTKQAPEVSDWIAAIETQADRSAMNVHKDWQEHRRWWSDFWNRSWIIAYDNTLPGEDRGKLNGEGYTRQRTEQDGGSLVAQSYNVFRFLMACQSRGRVQTKFNGGLFTQPLRYGSKPRMVGKQREDGVWISHEDDRLWGRRFTYQNQRLLYWPLLMGGDGDLMKPFFDYYWNLLPVRRAITRAWFGHDGTYYRENIEPTGGERDCSKNGTDAETKPLKTPPGKNNGSGYYHSYYFTCGLETVAMMIEHAKYSGDEAFRDGVLVPFAREILLFYDKHYQRDADGKLLLDPSMVLETWWIAVNPATDVSGLLHCLDELLAMKVGTAEDKMNWTRFRREIPDVHLHEIDGRMAIAPARSWAHRKNSENGLLYPVFPFRRFGIGMGSKDLVDWTVRHRTNPNRFGYKCWTQDQIHWAYAGNAIEAMDGLVHRFRNASDKCRFPLYGSEGPDSCPDFDHFGAGSAALQRMLVQEAGDKILLLPAWPADWDVDFKLHVSGGAVVSGTVGGGKLQTWDIEPASRKKDVVVHAPQKSPERPVVPANDHALRIGRDQSGGNRFRGEVGRVTLFRGPLEAEDIRDLAARERGKEISGESVLRCVLVPQVGEVVPTKTEDLMNPVSFEVWIKPGEGENGRIMDKLTPGQRDGFLLDCHPGLSLRVIVGPDEQVHKGVLKAGTWHHVVLVIDKRHAEVYLGGKPL
jgi:hypothetical protein